MEQLLELLKDGHARTTLMLAIELKTTPEDIKRKLEFMENMGIIKRVPIAKASCQGSCSGCSGCGDGGDSKTNGKTKKSKESCGPSCMPDAEIMNMGEIWEVVKA